MESVETDDTPSTVKKVSLDLKEYFSNLEAYSLDNGKGMVAIINNFTTNQKPGYHYRAGWCLSYDVISGYSGVYLLS